MMVKNAKESMDFFDRRTQTAKVRKITSNKYTRNSIHFSGVFRANKLDFECKGSTVSPN